MRANLHGNFSSRGSILSSSPALIAETDQRRFLRRQMRRGSEDLLQQMSFLLCSPLGKGKLEGEIGRNAEMILSVFWILSKIEKAWYGISRWRRMEKTETNFCLSLSLSVSKSVSLSLSWFLPSPPPKNSYYISSMPLIGGKQPKRTA